MNKKEAELIANLLTHCCGDAEIMKYICEELNENIIGCAFEFIDGHFENTKYIASKITVVS